MSVPTDRISKKSANLIQQICWFYSDGDHPNVVGKMVRSRSRNFSKMFSKDKEKSSNRRFNRPISTLSSAELVYDLNVELVVVLHFQNFWRLAVIGENAVKVQPDWHKFTMRVPQPITY